MSGAPRWELFPIREFDRLCATWDELNQKHGASPVLSAAFMIPLLREFGTGEEILAFCGGARTPCAAAIVSRTSMFSWTTFQPSQAPLGAWVQRSDVLIAEVMGSLVRALPGFSMMLGVTQQDPDLVRRPEDSGNTRTLDYIRTGRIRTDRSFEDYWKERDGKLRQEIGRRLRKLGDMGITPRLEVITEPRDVAGAVADYGRIESAGWKGKEGTALADDNRQGAFYTAAMENFCRAGRGRIYRYWFGERVAAMQLCVQMGETAVLLKTTFDEEYRGLAPGILLKRAYVEDIFRTLPVTSIELYGRLRDWQVRWVDEVRSIYHINHFRWAFLTRARQVLSLAIGAPAVPLETAPSERS